MAVLPDDDRRRIWRGLMRYASNQRDVLAGMTKTDLYDAIVATDGWIEANQASFNSALPATARNNLTSVQKTFLFCVVALARAGIGLLRLLIGEVD